MAKVLVNFQDEFLQEIDKIAEQEHRTRSSLIREAVRRYLSQHTNSGTDGQPLSEPTSNASQPLVANQV